MLDQLLSVISRAWVAIAIICAARFNSNAHASSTTAATAGGGTGTSISSSGAAGEEEVTSNINAHNADSASSSWPLPTLPIQDVNILVLTDVHSWVAGHRHEEHLDANYGHVISFYEHLKDYCTSQEKDLFFVMNGDFIDGTGLSTYPPTHLTPILQKMPWDALNIGNHELYKNSTVEYITQTDGFIDHWGGSYLTSNTLLVETNQPLGGRFKFLEGSYESTNGRNSTILTFGFLYNFDNGCEAATVERVEDVVQSDWFVSVLSREHGDFDAIVVLAHMGANNPLLQVILNKIREICGDSVAVQFITGHTHVRMNVTLDSFSESFEAGRFLDTVGFVSFDIHNDDSESNSYDASFRHEFIDGNVDTMNTILGGDPAVSSAPKSFITPNGKQVMEMIESAQENLGLFETLGCNSQGTLYFKRGLDEVGSLWGYYLNNVIPQQLFKGSTSKIFVQNPGAFRYNLYEGDVTVDDLVSMSPYNDTIYMIGSNIKGSEFIDAFGEPNVINVVHDDQDHQKDKNSVLPVVVVAGKVEMDRYYEVYSVDFDKDYVTYHLANVTERKFEPVPLPEKTTNIFWREYMEENWVCAQKEEDVKTWDAILEFFEEFTVMKIIAFLLSFMVIVFFGWMFLCRNVHPTRRVGSVDPADDDLSYFEGDSGMGEFSEDEDNNMFPVGIKSPSMNTPTLTTTQTTTKTNGGVSYQSIYPVVHNENGIV